MAPLSWPLLYFLSFYPRLGLAGQLFTGSLSPSVPTCAHDCVASFITENYPNTICSQKELDCLCKINSVSGFTLGEGVLRCVVSACSPGTNATENRVAAYYICSSINGAKSMTHGTITATGYSRISSLATPDMPEPSQSPMTSQSRTPSSRLPCNTTLSSSTTTSLPSLTTDTIYSTTPITFASGSPLPPPTFTFSLISTVTPITFDSGSPLPRPPTSTPSTGSRSKSTSSAPGTSTSPTATAIAAAAKPALSKPQIAGVAVAGVVTLLAVGALIFFLFCFRRRRNSRDHGSSRCSSFGDNKTYTSQPSSPGPYHPIGGNAEHGDRSRDLAHVEAQYTGPGNPGIVEGTPASYWRRSPVRAEEIGVALGSPAMMQAPVVGEAPKSGKRHRTMSQLLPDKPIYSLYPAPLRVNHLKTPTSPVGAVVPGAAGIGQRSATPLSKPAPLGNKSSDISPASVHRNFSNLRPSASDPLLDSRSVHSASSYSRQGRQRGAPNDSIRDLPHREVLNYGQWTQALGSLQKPVPARQSPSARPLNNQQKTAYDPTTGTSELGQSTQPGRQLSIPRKPVPRQPPPRRIRRPLTRYSSASETSFEDAGDEDDMPRAQAFLSPVAESSVRRSARGHDGYPRPPVSANSRYQRPEPVSPTPKSSQKRQPSPLITPATDPRLLKNMLKPLPEVPESDTSDSAMPLMGKRRTNTRVPHGPRPNPNESPRGETELTKSAKWKILVSPGLQGIENMGEPRSERSNEWGYSTPITRRAP